MQVPYGIYRIDPLFAAALLFALSHSTSAFSPASKPYPRAHKDHRRRQKPHLLPIAASRHREGIEHPEIFLPASDRRNIIGNRNHITNHQIIGYAVGEQSKPSHEQHLCQCSAEILPHREFTLIVHKHPYIQSQKRRHQYHISNDPHQIDHCAIHVFGIYQISDIMILFRQKYRRQKHDPDQSRIHLQRFCRILRPKIRYPYKKRRYQEHQGAHQDMERYIMFQIYSFDLPISFHGS